MSNTEKFENIKLWIEENKRIHLPSLNSEISEERSMASTFSYLRSCFISVYEDIEIESEKERYRKLKPEITELLRINDEIEEIIYKNQYEKVMEVFEIVDTQKIDVEQLPRELRNSYIKIKQYISREKSKNDGKNQLEEYLEKHPLIEKIEKTIAYIEQNYSLKGRRPKLEKAEFNYLEKTKQLQEFVNTNNRLPDKNSEELEERKLFVAISKIMREFIKPYYRLGTEEERKKYAEQNPEIYEVLNTMESLKKKAEIKSRAKSIEHLLKIKQWMEENNSNKLPSLHTGAGKEELYWANKLSNIRNLYIKTYYSYKTEDERKLYIIKHPEVLEVLDIYNELLQKEKDERDEDGR